MADEMTSEMSAKTEHETETTEHEIGTPRCAVCGKDTRQPIFLRQWDDELDEELEADVCSGDCAKAWIDGIAEIDADAEAEVEAMPLYAEGDEPTHPGWAREVEVAPGQAITYTAHAATDPQTVAALDELARAAYKQFAPAHDPAQTTEPEEAWQFEVSSNGAFAGTLTVERESERRESSIDAKTSTIWPGSFAYDATFTGVNGVSWRTTVAATDLAWLRRAAKRQAEKDAQR
jgi:hypothetical protein